MISCLCATYRRPEMLGEAIECFHRQDYAGDKELIVVNTEPEQEIVYSHPDVTVVNLPRRIDDLGAIRNLMAALSCGDILMMWDDDDIHLPWRLSQAQEKLDAGCEFFRPKGCWFWQKNLGVPIMFFGDDGIANFHAQGAMTRKCFRHIGGYRTNTKLLDDRIFEQDIDRRMIVANKGMLPVSQYAYIYRWKWTWNWSDPDTYDIERGQPIGKKAMLIGKIEIRPAWAQDYLDIQKRAIANLRVADTSRGKNKDELLDLTRRMEQAESAVVVA